MRLAPGVDKSRKNDDPKSEWTPVSTQTQSKGDCVL